MHSMAYRLDLDTSQKIRTVLKDEGSRRAQHSGLSQTF